MMAAATQMVQFTMKVSGSFLTVLNRLDKHYSSISDLVDGSYRAVYKQFVLRTGTYLPVLNDHLRVS
jgi:hypothetical protein